MKKKQNGNSLGVILLIGAILGGGILISLFAKSHYIDNPNPTSIWTGKPYTVADRLGERSLMAIKMAEQHCKFTGYRESTVSGSGSGVGVTATGKLGYVVGSGDSIEKQWNYACDNNITYSVPFDYQRHIKENKLGQYIQIND